MMGNRFAEAMKISEKEENLVKDFMTANLDLAKELAQKGAGGAELTEVEKKFISASALFFINGMIQSIGK